MGMKKTLTKIFKTINRREKIAIPEYMDKESLLQNKTALITGGSGGIGYCIAKKVLASGAKVIIAGTNKAKLEKCIDECRSKDIRYIIIDLNDIGAFDDKIAEAEGIFGSSIDIFVNSAGVNPRKGFFDIDEKDYDSVMDINVKGTFFMCQAIGRYMIDKGIKGHILNISSSSALRPAWSPYEMSKWTVRGFTKGLADTLIPYGIIVNAIAPGPTATQMLGMNEESDLDLPLSPIERYAEPDEIAGLATVLVSDLGNLVVGDTLYATGGSGVISLHH